MTTTPGLEWLTVGATVAYIHGDSVRSATVDKIGKRDVTVTVACRSEKFNITKARTTRDNITYLYRSGNSTWDLGRELAPFTDPRVAELQEKQKRSDARSQVRRWADEFQRSHEVDAAVDTAKKLREAIDVFLKLHDTEKD